MKFVKVIFVVFFVVTISAFNAESKEDLQPQPFLYDFEIEGRIINGHDASLGQFPYVVRLMTNCINQYSHVVCSGSLIGKEWVITAAHCVSGLGDIFVYLGAVNHYYPETHFSVPNSNSIVHPDWNGGNLHNDIALVKIPAVIYTSRTRAIELPAYSSPQSSYANNAATIIGWGATADGSSLPDNLQYASVNIMSQEECGKKLDLIDSMICIATKPSSICSGDSGGPLVSDNKLVGVTSFHINSCNSGYPAGFTRITSFLWWIKKHTGISY